MKDTTKLTVGEVMTPAPHSVGAGQSLMAAHRLMRQFKVRHLPVLDGGALVGVISERELSAIEAISPEEAERVRVEEAMEPDPLQAAPDSPLAPLVAEMADRKIGSVVVLSRGKLAGVFTTTDAMRVLSDLLSGRAAAA